MKISDDTLDKRIKEKINLENSYIPQEINQIFDKSINNIRTKRNYNIKKVAGICIALFAIVIIFGNTITTYATNVPIISNLLEIFKSNRYENYDKYSSDLNITKESNGIKTTITNVIYDGIELAIFYTIESEKPMKDIPYFLTKEINIDDKLTTFGYGGFGSFSNNNKIYTGVISYNVGLNSIMPKEEQEKYLYGGYVDIPDEFMLSIKVNKIGDIKETETTTGDWIFDIPVSNEKLKGMVKEYDLNIDLSSIYEGAKLNKLIMTPINTTIQGYIGDIDLYFIVLDDKGRFIIPKDGGGIGGDNGLYISTSFKQVFEDTESLTFIPYERNSYKLPKDSSSSDNNVVEDYNLSSKLNINGETILKSKEGKDFITITRIETSSEKTKLYFKSEYGLLAAPKRIIDKTNNTTISTIDNFDSKDINTSTYLSETGEFMIEFDGMLTGGDYEIEYYDISEKVSIYNNEAFTIKLNK